MSFKKGILTATAAIAMLAGGTGVAYATTVMFQVGSTPLDLLFNTITPERTLSMGRSA